MAGFGGASRGLQRLRCLLHRAREPRSEARGAMTMRGVMSFAKSAHNSPHEKLDSHNSPHCTLARFCAVRGHDGGDTVSPLSCVEVSFVSAECAHVATPPCAHDATREDPVRVRRGSGGNWQADSRACTAQATVTGSPQSPRAHTVINTEASHSAESVVRGRRPRRSGRGKAPPQGPCTPKHVKSPQRPFRTPV